MTSYTSIEQAAHAGANGHNSLRGPTHAQAEAGNYLKGRATLHGMRIAIENPRGTLRKWRAADGTSGANLQKFHYGYFEGVRGADGDELDCYIGPWPEAGMAYVVNQHVRGAWDEHKVMLGFPDQRTAEAAYLSNFNAGWPGLNSCIPCSIAQLKWWMANGDLSRPLTKDQLPEDGRKDMDKVLWDSTNTPMGASLAQVLYQIRAHDGADGLMFDRVSVADILADADGVLAMDALVVPLTKLEPRMAILQKVMDRAGGDVKVAAMQVSDPFTQRGTTNVAVVYELSDGQTVSVFFHNPDVTPKKIAPWDDVVSWKWMLNKKDVTIAVAPERGRDLNVREVATRIMMLAGKNSARFVANNAKRAAQMETIDGLKTELAAKEAELEDLTMQVRDAEQKAGLQPGEEVPERAPESPAYASALESAGFTNPSGNEWAKSVERADATLRLNIRIFGEPEQFRLVKAATFSNGITGTPSVELGTFASVDEAVSAAQAEADEFAASQPAVSTVLSDEEQAALKARVDMLEPQIEALTDSQLAMMAATSPLNIGGYDKLMTGEDAGGYLRDTLIQRILSNQPDDIEATLARWRELSAPAAAPATADISYRAVDDMFTAFYPNTPAGQEAWKEIAAESEGTGKVFTQQAEGVIAQLREAGYSVAEAELPAESADDLMAALQEPAAQPEVIDADKEYPYTVLNTPTVLYRSVSPAELESILKSGTITGGLNKFNPWDSRREVFFSDKLNARTIHQGEEISRRVDYAMLDHPLQQKHKDAQAALKKRQEEVAAEYGDRRQPLAVRQELYALQQAITDIEKESRTVINDMMREETEANALREFTSAVLQTKPLTGARHYSTRWGQSGMGDDDEFGFEPGQVTLADIELIHLVKAKEVIKAVTPQELLEAEATPDAPAVDLAAHMAAQRQARDAALEAGRAAYAANADRLPPEDLSPELKRAWLEGYDTAPPAAPTVDPHAGEADLDRAANEGYAAGLEGNRMPPDWVTNDEDTLHAAWIVGNKRGLAEREAKAAPAAPADDFSLTGESAEEARARIEQEEAAAAAKDAADRAAEKAAREEQERKEIAARQAASAENFELGQSPEDSLSGQRSLMDPPPEPAANPALTFLQSVIDGTADLGAASLAGDLSKLHAENKDDAEFMTLFKQAVKAYSAYAIAQANAAMAVAA